jgi:hypothetical protein
MNELQSPTLNNTQYLQPIGDGLTELLKGRNSRDKFNAKFWGELRALCERLAAADPEHVEFIELGSPQAYFYSRLEPHVLTQRIELVVRLKHVDHCLFVVVNKALTEEEDSQLIGHIGNYIPPEGDSDERTAFTQNR